MKVVLCDDHELMIEALAAVLSSRGWTVQSLALTPADGVAAAAEHRPDVCLMDLRFPDGDGLAAVRAISAGKPPTPVVVLSAMSDPAMVAAAAVAGSSAYVHKGQDVTEIVEVVERVARGEVVTAPRPPAAPGSPGTARSQGGATTGPAGSDSQRLAWFLTTREREVLRRLVLGQSTAQLAVEMGVEINTARTHVQNILVKLGVHSRLEAAALAVRASLVELPGRARLVRRASRPVRSSTPSPAVGGSRAGEGRRGSGRRVSGCAVQRSRVLVVDDHRAFAGALAARLSAEPDIHIVGAVVGCSEALAELAAGRVDLALVDVRLGAESGLELVRAMRDRQPDLTVVMVTEVDDEVAAAAAVRFGVSGWVLKHTPVEDLLRVLRGVLAGESWYPPRMLTGMLERLLKPADEDAVLGRLTPREREVLGCMVDGLDRQGIAERLYLSPNTVRTHVQNLLSKLGVHSGLEAVAVAVLEGLGG